MNYLGYRIKINGHIIPNMYMTRGTWNAKTSKRLSSSWVDAGGVLHEDYFEKSKAIITFQIKEHSLEEHEIIAALFREHYKVNVEYWDDDACDYMNCICKIEDFDWQHSNAMQNNIDYSATKVEITEY